MVSAWLLLTLVVLALVSPFLAVASALAVSQARRARQAHRLRVATECWSAFGAAREALMRLARTGEADLRDPSVQFVYRLLTTLLRAPKAYADVSRGLLQGLMESTVNEALGEVTPSLSFTGQPESMRALARQVGEQLLRLMECHVPRWQRRWLLYRVLMRSMPRVVEVARADSRGGASEPLNPAERVGRVLIAA